MPGSDRPLKPEERKLWRQVVETVAPLHEAFPPELESEERPTVKSLVQENFSFPPQVQKLANILLPLIPNQTAGIEKNILLRLRRGQIRPQATLDLHGMNSTEAYQACRALVLGAYAKNLRWLLVITGKGRGGPGSLKTGLLRWVNLAELRPLILMVHAAPQTQGGEGAYFLLLKKNRKSGRGQNGI